MRILPDPDALAFAESVRALLAQHCPPEALRAAWDSEQGAVPELWRRLADLGVTGLTVPAAAGGAGMDLTFAVPVLVEAGRAALPEPLAEHLAAVELLRGAGGDAAAAWLRRLAAGEALAVAALPPGELVAAADRADVLLLAGADGGVRLLTAADARVVVTPTLDRGLRLARVGGAGERLAGAGAEAVAAAFDTGCLASAAELLGLAQAALDAAVRYARQREQFGRPIGSFQAVQHQLADAYVAIAFAAPVVHRGAWSLAHALPSRARDASHAKLAAGRAATTATRAALQVHGAIGYTYEHDLHMWLKRTWSRLALWGDEDFHRARVAEAVLGDHPPPRVP